jgi:hypothetical protein
MRITKLRIKVRKHHIDMAVPGNSAHCMISEAIREAMPEARHINTDLQTIRFSDPTTGRRMIYFTPPMCQTALLEFDDGVKPEEWSFFLREPAQIQQRKSRRGKATTKGKPHTGVPIKRDGKAPPRGSLSDAKVRTGSIRRFGLRSMGRNKKEV